MSCSTDCPHELFSQFDLQWNLAHGPSLETLTDEEYLWEPVPGCCWSIRPTGPGGRGEFEQVFAGWDSGPLAHMPSGSSAANAAWTAIAAMSQNLLRAAGVPAGPLLAKARTAAIRRDIIAVAARAARRGRGHITLRLPEGWHRGHEWTTRWTKPSAPAPAPAPGRLRQRPDHPEPRHAPPRRQAPQP